MKIKPVGDPQQIFLNAMNMALYNMKGDGTKPGSYVLDKENSEAVKNLIDYFSGKTPAALHPRKGILLMGNPGSGKTLLMNVFQQLIHNTPQAFKAITCRKLAGNYSEKGIKSFNSLLNSNYYFDDLGREAQADYYGKKEVMHDVICDAYDAWYKSGYQFHFTTNENLDELSKRYGVHCRSRLRQMCNIIGLGINRDSKDRRDLTMPRPIKEITNFPKFFITEEEEQAQKERELIRKQYEIFKNTPAAPRKGLGERMREQFGTEEKYISTRLMEEAMQDAGEIGDAEIAENLQNNEETS